MKKNVVIISDHREEISDDDLDKRDLVRTVFPSNKQLTLELQLEDRFMGILDLVNYAKRKHNPNVRDRFVSIDNYVTLNGIFLADYLRKKDFEVSLIRNFVSQKERLKDLMQPPPLAVIISMTFITFWNLQEILKFLKTCCTENTAIIIGGPVIFETKDRNPSRFMELKNDCKGAFFVLDKQGEKSLLKLLNDLALGIFDIDSSYNIMMIDKVEGFKFSPRKEENNSIDDNIIDWESLPEDFLDRVVPMSTSSGCPCKCAFCIEWTQHPQYVLKSICNIKKELEGIKKRTAIKHIVFVDETLNSTKARIESICQLIIDAKLAVSWSAFIRAVPIDEGTVELLKKSNCKLLYVGFESFDDQILKNMNKGITFAEQMRCIKLLKSSGIGIMGSFVLGFPGETKETLRRTIKVINELGIDFYELFVFYYFPYAPIGKKKDEFKLKGNSWHWEHITMTSGELAVLLPDTLEHIGPFFEHFEGDTFTPVTLLMSKGLEISEIKEIFAIRRELMKLQNNGLTISEETLLRKTKRIYDIVMRVEKE